jgi:ribosomal protein S10
MTPNDTERHSDTNVTQIDDVAREVTQNVTQRSTKLQGPQKMTQNGKMAYKMR